MQRIERQFFKNTDPSSEEGKILVMNQLQGLNIFNTFNIDYDSWSSFYTSSFIRKSKDIPRIEELHPTGGIKAFVEILRYMCPLPFSKDILRLVFHKILDLFREVIMRHDIERELNVRQPESLNIPADFKCDKLSVYIAEDFFADENYDDDDEKAMENRSYIQFRNDLLDVFIFALLTDAFYYNPQTKEKDMMDTMVNLLLLFDREQSPIPLETEWFEDIVRDTFIDDFPCLRNPVFRGTEKSVGDPFDSLDENQTIYEKAKVVYILIGMQQEGSALNDFQNDPLSHPDRLIKYLSGYIE
jgi:hypothetical protein